MTPPSGRQMVVSRYTVASKDFFSRCMCVSIAADGSRIGGKEVLLVAVLGTTAFGEVKVCWAPPQVALEGHDMLPIPRRPQGQIDTAFC